MLDKLKSEYGDELDAIIVAGDHMAHGFSGEHKVDKDVVYPLLKEYMKKLFNEIFSRFPGLKIAPSVGNNDPPVHYDPPARAIKSDYYSSMLATWFAEQKNILIDIEEFMDHGMCLISL